MMRWWHVISTATLFGVGVMGCGSKTGPEAPEKDSEVDKSGVSEPIAERIALPVETVDQPEKLDREDTIAQAVGLSQDGNLEAAAQLFQRLLLVDPTDVEVLFQMAVVQAQRGDLAAAVECLGDIPEDHPEAGIPALGQSADWCSQLGRYDEAIRRYQRVLEFVPDAIRARRQLANLLNRQGRRHEAAEQIRELCRAGDVRQDELQSLVVLSDAMVSQPDQLTEGSLDYTPIGASGVARKLFTERRFAEAADVLRETVASGQAPPSIIAFYGRIVAEAQDDEAFRWWHGLTDDSVRQYSEYWAAVAAYLANEREFKGAIRALLEALDRDPTDFISINRLFKMFKTLDMRAEYVKWEQRWNAMNKILIANNSISDASTPDVESMEEMASKLNSIDRRLEAVIWNSLATYYRQLPQEAMAHWNQERKRLVAAQEGFPNQASRICGIGLDQFPLVKLEIARRVVSSSASAVQPSNPAPAPIFRNIASSVGLNHSFQVTPEPLENGFAMYHQAGGGVAVIDYDLDGFADLYFAQGAAAPPDYLANEANVLFRSMDGRLLDVTANAAVGDRRYTIGCTAGDWNQDGFPDLVTANIGMNQLWINNGDGTFSVQELEGSDSLQRMPASIALADLTGDHLPDIFEVNYADDPNLALLPERNSAGKIHEAVGPGDFESCLDRIGVNDGMGTPLFRQISDDVAAAHKGLGVVIADFDGQPGNDVFVGNDKSANQLWVRDSTTGEWGDIAILNGTAFSNGGGGTASMGIASGDFDKSGTIDLHIANFQNESVCLYLNRGSFFQDRSPQYGLGEPSRAVLGFGSQTLDYDNDGFPDLVVTNGHIDDYEVMSGPFKQLPQLFANAGERFELLAAKDESEYWNTPHLGRALATLDFDHNGQTDFVITHLGEQSALLRNETETQHWLQIVLVGTESERDAIGTVVKVEYGDEVSTEFITSGDGYLCRNEAVASFGLGNQAEIKRISIQWPTGVEQQFENVRANQRILIVEGQDKPFTLFLQP